MNGFEVIEVDISVVVVSVALDSASRRWTTLEVTILVKKRAKKKIDFVATIRTIN